MWFKKKKVEVPLPPKEKILVFPRPEEVFGRSIPLGKEEIPSLPEREKTPKPVSPLFPTKETAFSPEKGSNLPFVKIPIYQQMVAALDEINQESLKIAKNFDLFKESNRKREVREAEAFKNINSLYHKLLLISKKIKR